MPPSPVFPNARYTVHEQVWLAAVLVYTLAPVGTLLVYQRPRGVDIGWDFAMAVGIFAAGGLALLPLLSARWWAPHLRSAGFLRLVQDVHRYLAYGLVVWISVHVGLLCVLEPRTVGYLKPDAVPAMFAGLLGLLIVVFLILSSRYRTRLRWPYPSWRHWHALLSLATVVLAGWHVLGAGYYYRSSGALVAFLWLLAAPSLVTLRLRRWPLRAISPREAPERLPARGRAARVVWAIMLIWLAAALGFAETGHWSLSTEQTLCPVEPCL